jgi:hypothetical protein
MNETFEDIEVGVSANAAEQGRELAQILAKYDFNGDQDARAAHYLAEMQGWADNWIRLSRDLPIATRRAGLTAFVTAFNAALVPNVIPLPLRLDLQIEKPSVVGADSAA